MVAQRTDGSGKVAFSPQHPFLVAADEILADPGTVHVVQTPQTHVRQRDHVDVAQPLDEIVQIKDQFLAALIFLESLNDQRIGGNHFAQVVQRRLDPVALKLQIEAQDHHDRKTDCQKHKNNAAQHELLR